MFCVVFEVHPKSERWDDYLGNAKLLKPELEQVDGFVDNIRYKSLTRDGWVLSLSSWRDEKSVVRWRTAMRHHQSQETGRAEIFLDYHLRVGQITRDTRVPPGYHLEDQRLDATETGEGTTITLIDGTRDGSPDATALGEAARLGLAPRARGLVGWDVFDAVLTPGDVILLMTWRDDQAAEDFERSLKLAAGARQRRVRIVRDYGMYDRREAPQYFPDVRKPPADTP